MCHRIGKSTFLLSKHPAYEKWEPMQFRIILDLPSTGYYYIFKGHNAFKIGLTAFRKGVCSERNEFTEQRLLNFRVQ